MAAPLDVLVTRRLTLRPPLEVDVEGIARGLGNLNVSRALAPVKHPYTEDDARVWIEDKRRNPEVCGYTVHREQLIGYVTVHNNNDLPTLGYWFAEAFWGKGYATEAGRAVLARAFRAYGCDRITSYAFAENDASLRVMDKLGFARVGFGKTYCTALNEERGTVRTLLKRDSFEARFGSLETKTAA